MQQPHPHTIIAMWVACWEIWPSRGSSKALLSNVLNDIDNEFEQVFSLGITDVAFLVSKPLVREVALVDDDIPFAIAPSP